MRTRCRVILVDIDHFKRFNDLYGHQAGDDCIRQVASIIARAAKRPLDFCARYGGEEFALVLYAPSGNDPGALPEQIRRDIMLEGLPHADSDAASVITVSVGSAIAEPGTKRSLAGLIQTADEALYRAKQIGRNRVLHIDSGVVRDADRGVQGLRGKIVRRPSLRRALADSDVKRPMQYSRRSCGPRAGAPRPTRPTMNRFEATLEHWVFRSRWLLAPFFIGLLLAIIALLTKFVKALWMLALEHVHADGRTR